MYLSIYTDLCTFKRFADKNICIYVYILLDVSLRLSMFLSYFLYLHTGVYIYTSTPIHIYIYICIDVYMQAYYIITCIYSTHAFWGAPAFKRSGLFSGLRGRWYYGLGDFCKWLEAASQGIFGLTRSPAMGYSGRILSLT